jgi:hypothetical protein
VIPDDRDLNLACGDPCPRCAAHDGEPHSAACERARDAVDDTVAPATCGPVCVDADGREVEA